MFFPDRNQVSACGVGCQLNKCTKHPKLPIRGKGKKGILLVANAPSRSDKGGEEPEGAVWDHMDSLLHPLGIDLMRDCYLAYAVRCHAPDGVEEYAVNACFPYIWPEIERMKPRLIIPLGIEATEAFIEPRWKEGLEGIERWRGWVIPDRKAKAWLMPCLNPELALDDEAYPSEKVVLERDLKRALSVLDKPLPKFCGQPNDNHLVCVEFEERAILSALEDLMCLPDGTLVSFDYETTGKKPHRKGHDIVSCAFSASPSHAVAFPFESPAVRAKWVEFLRCKHLRKTAHQFKFEELWSSWILQAPVVGWRICTCLAAHIEDNRSKVSGLKFQTAVRFGVYDYSKSMERFLSCTDEEEKLHGANGINRIRKAPMAKLCLYNGLDALYGKWLATEQVRIMEE